MNGNYTGPPLPSHPTFRIMNYSYIEVLSDKPYAYPDFHIENYTLTIIYMEDER